MEEKHENNSEKVSDSQDFFVSLHQENKDIKAYGTDNHRRTASDVDEDHSSGRAERLGIHAYQTQGRPTLDRRWDTLVYEEGLQSEQVDDQLGGSRLAVRNESDRLIDLSRKLGDYIPSTVWDSFGLRNTKPSGESVVFIDEDNDRVIKFKDPFAYVSLKDDNPYTALYEHHIHNHFFGDVGYRFLGVSQDPVSGGVRFAFEQPFIETAGKPSKTEITDWFEQHGFKLTKDGFWYTDGYVSFTDVEGDNCIKDDTGKLHFIDPIIKFEKEPKEVIAHYIEQEQSQKKDSARNAILERVKDPSLHAAFTDKQLDSIKVYTDSAGNTPDCFDKLIEEMKEDFHKEGVPEEWVADMKEEYYDLTEKGIRREGDNQGLKV